MHPKTFDIDEFLSAALAEKAGYTIPLTKDQAEELKDMNRKQRRAWAKQEKKRKK